MGEALNDHHSAHQKRLQTFFTYPLPNSSEHGIHNSALKFAEAGFVRMPNAYADEVECLYCGAKYMGWEGESPLAVHRSINPKCIFLNTPPPSSSDEGEYRHGNHRNELAAIRKQLFKDFDISSSVIYSSPQIENPFLPKQGGYLMLFESHRLLSFLYSGQISLDALVYAEAGFMYNVTTRSVLCVFCNLELKFHPTQRSDLEDIHTEKSSHCPFINMFDVGNISLEAEKYIQDKVSGHRQKKTENDIKVNYTIKHPECESVSVRFGTFSTWPRCVGKVVPGKLMAECGFYYTGFSDKVVCYACGVGLSDWSLEAEPASQHAKASPHCTFMLKSKGKEFIDKAQNIQLLVETDQITTIPQLTELDTSTTASSISSSSRQSMAAKTSLSVSAAASSSSSLPGSPILDLEAIKAALACQYTFEQIAHAVKNFFTLYCRYPNTHLLLVQLKAKDENYERLCEKSQELLDAEAQHQAKEAHLLERLAHVEAERVSYQQAVTAKDRELQRTTLELEWRDLVRTEVEERFIEQLQQQREIVQQQREQIEQRDQVIEYNAVQLVDQEKHIRSLIAELQKRNGSSSSDDEESVSSDQEHSSSDCCSSSDEIPLANCKVCLVKPSQIMFLPCKHICCCDHCASRLRGKNCPICREQTTSFEKVYLI